MVATLVIVLAGTFPTANWEDAPGSRELLRQAESAFKEGIQLASTRPSDARAGFRKAAEMYERLLQSGAVNARLYRNLGNAYLLAYDPENRQDDSLAKAILAYRQGLRLAPSDLELQRNLAHARQQVVYPPGGTFGRPAIDHRPPWLPRWPRLWFSLAAVCYFLACLALVRWWMVRNRPWPSVAAATLGLMVLFLAAWGTEIWQIDQEVSYPLVVVARDTLPDILEDDRKVRLRTGNGFRYPPRYQTELNRGFEARLLYDRGRWLQVELGGGEIGWLPRAAVLVDQ